MLLEGKSSPDEVDTSVLDADEEWNNFFTSLDDSDVDWLDRASEILDIKSKSDDT